MSAKQPSRRAFLKAAAGTVGAGVVAAAGTGLLEAGTAEAAQRTVRTPKVESGAVLWGLQYAPHVAAYQRLAALFQKETGATIRVQPQPWPLDTKLIAATAAGTQPDVCCVLGAQSTDLFIQNVVLPVEDSVFKAKHINIKKDFIGDSVQAFAWNGHIWGVPVESNADGGVVNVPVDDVRAAGLGKTYPPTNGQLYFDSYPSMWQLAKALQTKRNGRILRWGLTSQGWEELSMFGIMRSLGVDWWDPHAKTFNVDSTVGVEAMKLLVETPVKMGIEGQITGQSSVDLAIAGKAALSQGNPTVSTTLTQNVGYHYELAGVPRVKPGVDPLFVGQGGWGFVGMRKSKRPAATMAFLRMMSTQAAQLEYAKIYGGLPFIAWAGLIDDTSRFANPSPNYPNAKASKVLIAEMPRTVYFGEGFGYYNQVALAVSNACAAVREGKMTSAAAVKQIQRYCEAQYQQYLSDLKKV